MDSEVRKLTNWRWEDYHPDTELDLIPVYSERMSSAVARAVADGAVDTDALFVLGGIEMVESLEYHYSNYSRIVRPLSVPTGPRSDAEARLLKNAKFEILAYISVLGRLYYWGDFENQEGSVIKQLTESFRHKVAAHRSIDAPRNEPEEVLESQALSIFGGTIWNPDGRIHFQINMGSSEPVEFDPLIDHPKILDEVYAKFTHKLNFN